MCPKISLSKRESCFSSHRFEIRFTGFLLVEWYYMPLDTHALKSRLCGAFRRIFSLVYGNPIFICIRILPITDMGIKKQTACEDRLLII